MIFEGDYLNDKKWNGKVYDYLGNLINEFILGSTKDLKDDDEDDNEKEVFKGWYSNGKITNILKIKTNLIILVKEKI